MLMVITRMAPRYVMNVLENSDIMRILVCGSRRVDITVEDISNVFKVLSTLLDEFSIHEIISGGAIGPDRVAIEWAKQNSCGFNVYDASWAVYGRSAGMIRNKEMVEKCDICVGFWDGKSRGTEFTLDCAVKMNRKTYVVDCSNGKVGDVWVYPKGGYKTKW